jgi:CBS domain-containing protein
MGQTSSTRRISHPILRLAVVGEDGTRQAEPRVFCRYQRRAIPVEVCRVCGHCDNITGEPDGVVACTVPRTPDDVDEDPDGGRTDVATVLLGGTIVLDPNTSVDTALALMRGEDRRSLAVVDAHGTVVGVLHEAAFVGGSPLIRADADGRSGSGEHTVARAMSSPLALPGRTSVREALRLLAAAHLREATVVDQDGTPLGVFRDVDGLRFVAACASAAQRAQ